MTKTAKGLLNQTISIGDTVLFGDKGQSCSYLHIGTVEDIKNQVVIRGKASGRLNNRYGSEVFVLTNVLKDMPELLVW